MRDSFPGDRFRNAPTPRSTPISGTARRARSRQFHPSASSARDAAPEQPAGVPAPTGSPSPTVLASCPDCGDVSLAIDDVTLRICAEDYEATFCFRCPECGKATTKPADDRIVERLASAGARTDLWHRPQERHPIDDDAPLTPDHVDEFRRLLATDDWFERLRDVGSS